MLRLLRVWCILVGSLIGVDRVKFVLEWILVMMMCSRFCSVVFFVVWILIGMGW